MKDLHLYAIDDDEHLTAHDFASLCVSVEITERNPDGSCHPRNNWYSRRWLWTVGEKTIMHLLNEYKVNDGKYSDRS